MKKTMVSFLSLIIGFIAGGIVLGRFEKKIRQNIQEMSDKHLALFLMMNQWLQIKQDGKNLAEYLIKNGYANIAIYGMSYAGESLLREFKNSDVKVKYGIDKRADGIYSEINIMSPNDILENVDAVIVTSVFFMDEIEAMLSQKVSCPILSLNDILYEI